MPFTWLVPQPMESYFGNEKFGRRISTQRVIAVLHALEYLVFKRENDALHDIKTLNGTRELDHKTKILLGPDLERAFRTTPSANNRTREGTLSVVKGVLNEQGGSFTVKRGGCQFGLQKALFYNSSKKQFMSAAKHIGEVRVAHPELFVEIRQTRDFAIPDEPRFREFFSLLAAGRLTNEKGFSARAAELVVFGTRIEDGMPHVN